MANTNITPTVGALTASSSTSVGGILGSPVLMGTGLRPEHAWLEGLRGKIVTIRRGGSFRVHLVDSIGHYKAARVKSGEVA
jgi:hypothetical protein